MVTALSASADAVTDAAALLAVVAVVAVVVLLD